MELEGLVTIIPNKGAYVTAITRKDVKDIYKIRSQLEGLCANWATKYITDAQIEASNSRILEHVLTDFHKYVQLARTMSIEAPERAEKSIEEHREILEAIKAKDAAKAEQLANEHILHVMENLHLEE